MADGKTYEKPSLTELGSVYELTLGADCAPGDGVSANGDVVLSPVC